MTLPADWRERLTIPAICAPMFLVSGPELVTAACKAGVIGAFPTINARPVAALDDWLTRIRDELAAHEADDPQARTAPFAANLIVHRTNPRLEEDLELVLRHEVPVVITSVGDPTAIVERVHAYGGVVLHDAATRRHAEKAAAAGVDALILLTGGAGGQTGWLNPLAFVAEAREVFAGPLVVAGGISNGAQIRACEVMGADMAYLGSRFIATQEAQAHADYKRLLVEGRAADVMVTSALTGIPSSILRSSVIRAGLDPDALGDPKEGGANVSALASGEKQKTAWRDIWSAGQGVGGIADVPPVADLVARLVREYRAALDTPVGVKL
jgi:nitronate monooxygenase